MYKLFFIVVCLLLNSNVAEAKFDEDLQKRCVDTNELPNPASDSKHAGFNIVEQRSILTHVKFSKEDRPVSYECQFGREKESNEWFILNAI